MKNVKEQAKLAALRSRCKNCPLHPHRCTAEILKACTDSFVEGYVKGAKEAEKEIKTNKSKIG